MLAFRSIVLGTLVVLSIGCSSQLPSDKQFGSFSAVFCKFDPAAEFAQRGFRVEAATAEGGRINPQEKYGWRPLQGTLQLSDTSAGCEDVAKAVYESLLDVSYGSCRDELTHLGPRERGQPLYGMLRYEKENMRGHVYVWLFPDKSETNISYAILIHEERAAASPDPTTVAMKATLPAI